MNRVQVLVTGTVLVLAVSSVAAVGAGTVTIDDATDDDCDNRLSEVTLSVSVAYSQSGDLLSRSDPYALLEYSSGGSWNTIERFEDVSGRIFERQLTVTAADLSAAGEDPTRVRVEVVDADLIQDDTLAAATSDEFVVEPESQDSASLDPVIRTESALKRGQPAVFVAGEETSGGCPVEQYGWDFDGDGTFEQRGERVQHTYEVDGYRTVTLRVETSRGTTATVSRDVLVVYDPDGDGVTNAIEEEQGTDPRDPDTDDDLFDDGNDPAPTSFLFPTGLFHVVLFALLYGVVRYDFNLDIRS